MQVLPLPALDIIALESPTLATYRWLPTNTAVDAVEPSSRKVSLSESKKLASVCRYVSPASLSELPNRTSQTHIKRWKSIPCRTPLLVNCVDKDS